MVSLVIGGARSGKSRFAQSLACRARKVAYIATARVEDAEMADRIARHRGARPALWFTVEAPLEIGRAVERCAADCDVILLDCLTIWLSNFLWERRELPAQDTCDAALREVAHAIGMARHAHLVMVTNEVGCGLVPESPVGRAFRDAQGWVNQEAAQAADWVYHVVAGIATPIKRPEQPR